MHRIKAMFATLALSGLAMSIPATVSAQGAGARNSAPLCRVVVNRNASSGVFDITRFEPANGRCICRVSTGPRTQGGSAETALASLLLRRTCADAPLGVATAAGGMGTGTWIGLALLGGGGIAAALAAGGSSSP